MSSASRGLAPREGLGFVLVKMGRAGPPFEPRRRPQAGKSGYPIPRTQTSTSPTPMLVSERSPRLWAARICAFRVRPACFRGICASGGA